MTQAKLLFRRKVPVSYKCYSADMVQVASTLMRRGLACALWLAAVLPLQAADTPEALFRARVEPILKEYCSDCHADGANKGNVAFDRFKTTDDLLKPELWAKVLKNTRAELMRLYKRQPSVEEKQRLEEWIKRSAFQIEPGNRIWAAGWCGG